MKNSTFINRLKCLRELNNRNLNFINIDLYKLIIREDSLVAGYEKINSNKGATTFKKKEKKDEFLEIKKQETSEKA